MDNGGKGQGTNFNLEKRPNDKNIKVHANELPHNDESHSDEEGSLSYHTANESFGHDNESSSHRGESKKRSSEEPSVHPNKEGSLGEEKFSTESVHEKEHSVSHSDDHNEEPIEKMEKLGENLIGIYDDSDLPEEIK